MPFTEGSSDPKVQGLASLRCEGTGSRASAKHDFLNPGEMRAPSFPFHLSRPCAAHCVSEHGFGQGIGQWQHTDTGTVTSQVTLRVRPLWTRPRPCFQEPVTEWVCPVTTEMEAASQKQAPRNSAAAAATTVAGSGFTQKKTEAAFCLAGLGLFVHCCSFSF